jgi:hypothetical protein
MDDARAETKVEELLYRANYLHKRYEGEAKRYPERQVTGRHLGTVAQLFKDSEKYVLPQLRDIVSFYLASNFTRRRVRVYDLEMDLMSLIKELTWVIKVRGSGGSSGGHMFSPLGGDSFGGDLFRNPGVRGWSTTLTAAFRTPPPVAVSIASASAG